MLELLNHPVLQNPYVLAIGILISFFAISKIIHIILAKYVLMLTKKTKTDLDDRIVAGTNRPISILLLVIGVYLAFSPFRESFKYVNVFENFTASLFVVMVTYIIIIVADILIEAWGRNFAKRTESTVDDDLISLFHRFSRIALFLIGLMFILPVWGIQIGPLLASLGIAGIAIAFALQATLSNIFGGASMIIDKAVKVGDVIELDNGVLGIVKDVGLRSTRIQTYDNELIILPNGKLADMQIKNMLLPDAKVRGVVLFGVEYGSDVDNVKDVARKAMSKVEDVLKEPIPDVAMLAMADFSLNFRATFWVDDFNKRFPTKCAVTESIYNALNEAGIGIPFPTRTVYMKDGKK